MSAFGVGGGAWNDREDPEFAAPTDEKQGIDPNIIALLPDNSKTTQIAPIDPSSGEVITYENRTLGTWGNTLFLPNIKQNPPAAIGANGEVVPAIKTTTLTNKAKAPIDIFSGTTGEILITVLATVLGGVALYYVMKGLK
jgi:hypothetical protein